MRRWALRAALVFFELLELAVPFGSTVARAEERPHGLATFEWTRAPGAEGCLSKAEIVEEVEQSLRRRVFAEDGDRVLRAAIGPAPPSPKPGAGREWHATIELSTRGGLALGAREIALEGDDCREASAALVLAISLMADLPELPAERPLRVRPSPVRPTPVRPPPTPPPVRFRAAIAPAVAFGDRMPIHPALDLALEIRPRAFVPIVIDSFFQLHTRGTSRGQRYWLFGSTLAITLCPLSFKRSRLDLLGCLGPQATLYAARGRGFATDETAFSSTFGGLLETRISYAFTATIRGFALAGAAATPQRIDLFFGDAPGEGRVLGRTPYVTGIAALGVTLEL